MMSNETFKKHVACVVIGGAIGGFIGNSLIDKEETKTEAMYAITKLAPKIERAATVAGEMLISEESQFTGMAYGQFDALYNNGYNPNNNDIHETYGDVLNLVTYDIGYQEGYKIITELKESRANINESDIDKSVKDVQMFWNNLDKEYIYQLASIEPEYIFGPDGEYLGVKYQTTEDVEKKQTR